MLRTCGGGQKAASYQFFFKNFLYQEISFLLCTYFLNWSILIWLTQKIHKWSLNPVILWLQAHSISSKIKIIHFSLEAAESPPPFSSFLPVWNLTPYTLRQVILHESISFTVTVTNRNATPKTAVDMQASFLMLGDKEVDAGQRWEIWKIRL